MSGTSVKKASPGSKSDLGPEVASKVSALKGAAEKAYGNREFAKALEQWEQAAKLLPEGARERVDILINRASAYYAMKKFKHAAKECSNALAIAPTSARALQRRAKSLEQQGLYKQALSDIQAINRGPSATDATRDLERRLRDTLAGRRPASPAGAVVPAPANGAAAAATAQQQQQQQQQQQRAVTIAAKCSLGDETRVLHLTSAVSYAQLLDGVKAKFPDAGSFKLKYTDRDGDGVTLTCWNDVRAAMQDALTAVAAPKGGLAPMAPSMKITLVPCGESEVPPPPGEELAQLEAIRRRQEQIARIAAARAEQQAAAASQGQQQKDPQQQQQQPAAAATPSGEIVEIDDWLVDFANLFRRVSGIDADGHAELAGEGYESAQRAMEATLRADEAAPLLDAAAERFREVACNGLYNWGNVHLCVAHKLLDGLAEADAELDKATEAKAVAAFDKAEERFLEALRLHADYVDGLVALAQLEFERAKLRARLIVRPTPPPPAPEGGGEPEKAAADAFQAAQAEALRAALAKVKAADVEAARPHLAKAEEWFGKSAAAAVAADAKRQAEKDARAAARKQQQGGAAAAAEAEAPAAAAPAPGEPGASYAANARIMHGNTLYEWSQLLAAAGAEWRAALDAAVERFKAAECTAADLRSALKNHTHAHELDLGPEPEPEPEAKAKAEAAPAKSEAAKAEAEAKAPKAKGLPALSKKK
ncbi:hypothetical protein Rsub_01915 [Raphidocelis subcapitata]|uniref:PB1 domain-containing protein n=1 Tax=Raphidocelis subcapitata TaxID=307507 RepID=A0A2V0NNP0_9CHLO|nr:hypothetical protein Rsub_01915 [Raphidocelis subcapitata]|eukprot:GBF89198.1 hypothetical protein Rsub_01915 [Raphidocelis subcapitata]